MWGWIGENSSNLIAIAALAVAVGSLLLQHRHNKLSVGPLLVTNTQTDDSEGTVTIELSNCGIGPALITRFEIWSNGVLYLPPEDGDYNPFTPQLQGIQCLRRCGFLASGTALEQGEKFTILRVKLHKGATFKDGMPVTATNLRPLFKGVDLVVRYESMYGEKRLLNTARR